MGRFGKDKDAPRVVGFDFAALGAAPVHAAPAAVPFAAPDAPYDAPYDQPTAVATLPPPAYPPPAYPAPGYPPPAYPAPAFQVPAWAPYVEPRSARRHTRVAVVWLLVLVAAGAGVAVKKGIDQVLADSRAATPVAVHAPNTVGGQPRMSGDVAERFVEAIRENSPDAKAATIAVYGRGDTPRYVFMAIPSSAGLSRDPLREFLAGANDAGVKVSAPKTFGDIICGTASSSTSSFAMCAWSGNGTDGAVVGFTKTALAKLAATTAVARTAATT